MKVSRILHAGYLFESGGTRILFDPIFENPFSRNCFAFPKVEFDLVSIANLSVDAIFISHYHDDHLSFESLNHLDRKIPIYVFCLHEEMFDWLRRLGFSEVISLNLNTTYSIGSFSITPRRALDAEVDSIFHITAEGVHLLNVVDSWIDESTMKILTKTKWDMVLWPFQTMREIEVLSPARYADTPVEIPPEWVAQLKELAPKVIVPSSCQFTHEPWSWYNHALFPISYRFFKETLSLELPDAEIVRLDPSVSVQVTPVGILEAESLSWVRLSDPTMKVDYLYEPLLAAPNTSEVATHFRALTATERSRVLDYCTTGIAEKFATLEPYDEGYFLNVRNWRLVIYDHVGQAIIFDYELEGSCMRRSAGKTLSWLTEVPMTKLYDALEKGESLTSMYLRINDVKFDPETEVQLQDVSPLDDPLVRCLYDNEFGSYQAAQLRSLLHLNDSVGLGLQSKVKNGDHG